jgi:hypothetical protein
MVRGAILCKFGESTIIPIKISAVNHNAGYTVAVTSYPLGGGVCNNAGSIVQRPEKIASSAKRVVNDQGNARFVADIGQRLEIGNKII